MWIWRVKSLSNTAYRSEVGWRCREGAWRSRSHAATCYSYSPCPRNQRYWSILRPVAGRQPCCHHQHASIQWQRWGLEPGHISRTLQSQIFRSVKYTETFVPWTSLSVLKLTFGFGDLWLPWVTCSYLVTFPDLVTFPYLWLPSVVTFPYLSFPFFAFGD